MRVARARAAGKDSQKYRDSFSHALDWKKLRNPSKHWRFTRFAVFVIAGRPFERAHNKSRFAATT